MIRVIMLASWLAWSSFSPPSAASNTMWPWKFADILYSVGTPSAVTVKRREMADFDIYTFAIGSRVILSAYVGNNPSFPMFSHNRILAKKHDPINGLRADTIIYRTPADTRTRETLVTLKQKPHTWGEYIHFYYKNISTSDSNSADAIIKSLESDALQPRT